LSVGWVNIESAPAFITDVRDIVTVSIGNTGVIAADSGDHSGNAIWRLSGCDSDRRLSDRGGGSDWRLSNSGGNSGGHGHMSFATTFFTWVVNTSILKLFFAAVAVTIISFDTD
jgi:hypothetical protein